MGKPLNVNPIPLLSKKKWGLTSHYKILLCLTLSLGIYKLFFYLLFYLSWEWFPQLFSHGDYHANFHWPEHAQVNFLSLFKTWDGSHYLSLADQGYQPGHMANVMYPLWPFLIKITTLLTPFGLLESGLLLTNSFSILAFVLLYHCVETGSGEETAGYALLLLLCVPGSLFFSLVYTESLFLILSVLLFWGLQKSRLWLAGLAAFLLPLTRPVGLFSIVPLFIHLFLRRKTTSLKDWLICLCPLLGFCAYLLFMQIAVGDAFEGFKAQLLFPFKASIGNLFKPIIFIQKTFVPLTAHSFYNSAIDRFMFAWFLVSLPFIWRWNKPFFFYTLFLGLVPAMSLYYVAYTRYFVVIFPVFIVTAKGFQKLPSKSFFILFCAVLFSVQLLLLLRHINNHWVA